MGIGWFVGAIFLLAFATYMMAYYIHNVLKFFKYPPPPPRDPILEPEKQKSHKVKTQDLGNQVLVVEEDEPKPPPLNIWRELSKVREHFAKEEKKKPAEETASAQAGGVPQGLQTPPPPPPSEKAADSQEDEEQSEHLPGILGRVTKRVRFGRAQVGQASSV
jgi:hypothetical protein